MSAFANYTAAINAAGALAFETSGFLETLKTNMSSTNTDVASEALELVKTLCETVDQWIEPYMVSTLPIWITWLTQRLPLLPLVTLSYTSPTLTLCVLSPVSYMNPSNP